MKIFGIVGWSGSGKTTLMVNLLPELVKSGLRVSTMKHAHHDFDIDQPGKDSFEHRAAGATEVMVASARRWALMHELRQEPEAALDDLIARMEPVDLLLIEGFKTHPHPKIEVHRPTVGKPPLYGADKSIVAVAADCALPDAPVPVLALGDAGAVAAFIVAHCSLKAA